MRDETKQEEVGREVPQIPWAALAVAVPALRDIIFAVFWVSCIEQKIFNRLGALLPTQCLPPAMNETLEGLLKAEIGFTRFPASSHHQNICSTCSIGCPALSPLSGQKTPEATEERARLGRSRGGTRLH